MLAKSTSSIRKDKASSNIGSPHYETPEFTIEGRKMNQEANKTSVTGYRTNGHTSPHNGDSLNGISSSTDTRSYDTDEDAEYRSADEEETRLVPNEPSRARKITQKKKLEQANFSKWLTTNRENLTKKTTKVPLQQAESLRYMVKSWEGGDKIIGKARDYQMELFERAKNENTIAVLDTGEISGHLTRCLNLS